ncbi:hypothetical protein D3C75_449150 [compost metagenome]
MGALHRRDVGGEQRLEPIAFGRGQCAEGRRQVCCQRGAAVLLDDVCEGQLPRGDSGDGQAGERLFTQFFQFRRPLAGMGGHGVGGHQPRRMLFTTVKLGLQGVLDRVAGQRQKLQRLRVVVGRLPEHLLLQCLAGGEPLQAAEMSGPVEQHAVAGRRQQCRWPGKQQYTVELLGVRAEGVVFAVSRGQHQSGDHHIGRSRFFGCVEHGRQPLIFIAADLIQAQLQVGFGTQATQARLVQGLVMCARRVAQFQQLRCIVGA